MTLNSSAARTDVPSPSVDGPSKNRIGDALASALEGPPKRSQQWLGEQLGVTQTQVSRWVKGLDAIRPVQVFAIEHALELPPGSLSRLEGYVPVEAATGYVDFEQAILAAFGEEDEALARGVVSMVNVTLRERMKERRGRR